MDRFPGTPIVEPGVEIVILLPDEDHVLPGRARRTYAPDRLPVDRRLVRDVADVLGGIPARNVSRR